MRKMFIFALVLLLGSGFSQAAMAHADLVSSEPAADATLTSAPSQIKLLFDEALKTGTTAVVRDAAGKQVDNKDGKIDLNDLDRKTFLLTLPSLADGAYTVEWKSVSDADGDQDEGTFSFRIGAAAQPTAAATARPTNAPAAPTATTAATQAPTATAAPAGGTPTKLPQTGAGDANGWGIPLALGLLAAGVALRRALLRKSK